MKAAAVGSVNSLVVWAMNWHTKTSSLKATRFDDQVIHPKIMEEIWMPVGAKHHLSSPGPAVRVLEIAFDNWQQEDIMRFSDDYQRPSRGE